ncbi:BTAD domain-containing putative transcriptional regulator [Amycolatopsis sp. WQ 127309]|uniref:BTAD domain-containing putative transcriptional regulator n=1 Tax=Amycolatopsis sp. WQ 127309 TaxID=2932773 RepID=UPI001FF13C38|nr:BTAD domain-containing putative transcriptional regulator [Amycolatopsis sp. WQ 127309]UOZ06297.1 NB-ARC domain-containing protein [Amycolatopsis sp. WQ 127309]
MKWSHRRERNITAALLTQPGKRVSIESLVDWAWNDDEERPRSPKGALYKCAARIRQALEGAVAPATLVADNGGYRLDVDPDLIDYHVFRWMMRHAHGLSDQGNHQAACEAARNALALWNDEPLAGITSAAAENWRVSVTDNDWIPASTFLLAELLTAGHPAEALGLLDQLGHAYSTELWFAKLRLQALTAIGRYRARDEYFREMYRTFRQDHDVQAADDLRALNEHLRTPERLAGPTGDDGPDLASPPGIASAPLREVPRDIGHFTGRDDVLASLDATIIPRPGPFTPALVTLTGPPGVGKTSTAVRWAHRTADRFPGGVALVDLHGVGPGMRVESADVVDNLLSASGYPVDRIVGAAGRAKRLRGLLSDHPMLVVLDNAQDTEHIETLLSVLSDCAVIITSRQRLTRLARQHHSPVITLAPLAPEAAVELLDRRLGNRLDREPEALANLATLCGGMPLALTIVAERATVRAGSRLRTLVDQLRDPALLLTIGDDGDGDDGNLLSAFSWSYQGLDPAAQDTFRLFGLHPGPEVGAEVLAAAGGVEVAAGRRALDILVSAHLVQQPNDGDRYRIHDLFHHFARTLVSSGPEADAARSRMASYYLHTAHNAHRMVYPHRGMAPMPEVEQGCAPTRFTDPVGAMRWCLRERANLNAMVTYSADHGLHGYAWRLPHVTGAILNRFGFYDDIIAGLVQAARSAAALGDHMAEAASLNDLGYVSLLAGYDDVGEVYLEQALHLATVHVIPIGTLTVRLNMARYSRHAGRLPEAVRLYERCLHEARTAGDAERQATASHELGKSLVELDQGHRALHHFHRAQHLRTIIGDDAGLLATLTELTDQYRRLGEFTTAEKHCRQAFQLSTAVRDLVATMKLYTVRAHLASAQDRHDEAFAFARDGLALAFRAHTATAEARALTTLGHVLASRGDLGEARAAWRRAVQLYRNRRRHAKAEQVEHALAEAGPEPEIPEARTADKDTVSLPAPTRHSATKNHLNG